MTNNGQSAAKPLLNEEGSTTIPNGSTGDKLGKGSYYNVKIYTLAHPITNEIRYIGKTKYSLEKRLAKHLVTNENNHRANWVKSILKIGLVPTIELLEEVPNVNWQDYEKYWILQFKSWGFNLVNGTIGGEEGIISDKCRKACIEANKRRKGKCRNWSPSLETRKRISEKLKGRKLSLKTLNKRSKTMKGIVPINAIAKSIEKTSKQVAKYDLNNTLIEIFKSLSEAARSIGSNVSSIHKCCNNIRNKHKGYIWKYYNNDIV